MTCGSRRSRRAKRWRVSLCSLTSLPHKRQVWQELTALRHFSDGLAFFEERAGGADVHAFSAGSAGIALAPASGQIGDDFGLSTAPGDIPSVGAFDLMADPNATGAENAAVVID